eukprot:COSAG01_NODE_9340_length_2478_cov_4.725515_1_plen_239_part_00
MQCANDYAPQIKLLATDQVRVVYILLCHVVLTLRAARVMAPAVDSSPDIQAPRGRALPVADLAQLGKQEDTTPLCGAYRLHDPGGLWVAFEFLVEQSIFLGDRVCCREKVKVGGLLQAPVFLKLLPGPFEVFNHIVLAAQLVIIAKVVDTLPFAQFELVHVLTRPHTVSPHDVPVCAVRVVATFVPGHLSPALPRAEDIVDSIAVVTAPTNGGHGASPVLLLLLSPPRGRSRCRARAS